MIYEFRCKNGHITERYLPMSEKDSIQPCNTCDQEARRIMSVPNFQLEGISGDFPTAADKFARMHEEAGKHNEPE